MISQSVGKNIARLRKNKHITAEQLADAINVSRQTLSKWENGLTIPDAYNMVDIATYLDIPISEIYVQIFYDKEKPDLSDADFVDVVNQMLNPRNIEKAIIAYDRNPNKLVVKVGVNVISYRDILLLSTNMGYFKGFSEIENPVSYHNAKSEDTVLPELAQYLQDKGFITFFAGGDLIPPNSTINSEKNGAPDGKQMIVILRNEKDVLSFKTAIRELFTGIVSVECKRDWTNPSGMKYLLCMHNKDENLEKFESTYQKYVSSKDKFTEEEEVILEKARKKIDEWRQVNAEEYNPIQYIKDDQELNIIRKQLESLDKKTMEEFKEACFGVLGSIMILDLNNKEFLPL